MEILVNYDEKIPVARRLQDNHISNVSVAVGIKSLAALQTASERQRTALESALAGRRLSDDYETRAYALSDSHFGEAKN